MVFEMPIDIVITNNAILIFKYGKHIDLRIESELNLSSNQLSYINPLKASSKTNNAFILIDNKYFMNILLL